MSNRFDLIIRNGTVIDGTGAEPREADVAVQDGRIAAIGHIPAAGREEIDAKGMAVTPGFVDVHTHYDGQVTWDDRFTPSSGHGVTTVLMGNCGVGFAPCRPQDRDTLIKVMEGVEDIPEIVMREGVPWNWQSFPEYLDALAVRRCDIDFATQVPHAPLRVFVMGERALRHEPATLSPMLKRLETLGYVTRARTTADERVLAVELTDQGRALRKEAEKIPYRVVEELGMDLGELEELHAALSRVLAATQKTPGATNPVS